MGPDGHALLGSRQHLRGKASPQGVPGWSTGPGKDTCWIDLSEGQITPESPAAPTQQMVDRCLSRMRRLRPIDFARFRWVTRLREGHRLQMEVLHGGWWGWVCRAV